ncbi:unnamed protein product [Diamesa hyperborea]
MKTLTLTFVVLVLAVVGSQSRAIESEEMEMDNSLGGSEKVEYVEKTEYLKISEAPEKDVYQHHAGNVELECKVTGSPAPSVKWIHGSGSHINHAFESNAIFDVSQTGFATVVSRISVKQHHASKSTYTCVGTSGGKTVTSTNEAPQTLASELINELVAENKVRISNFYENIFDLIGSNIILPCVNNMKAEIYWLNDDMEEIKGQEPRFKIMPTGELLITNLQFKDMGTYTCFTKNTVSKDVINTFVYPLAPTNKK